MYNLRKIDKLIRREKGLSNPQIRGVNNTKVSGQNETEKIINRFNIKF